MGRGGMLLGTWKPRNDTAVTFPSCLFFALFMPTGKCQKADEEQSLSSSTTRKMTAKEDTKLLDNGHSNPSKYNRKIF